MSHDDRKTASDAGEPPQDENQIIAERRGKLNVLRAQGQAFPNDFRRDALSGDLHAQYDPLANEALEPQGIRVAVAGRMVLKRVMGKACFGTLQDMSGRLQLYVTLDGVGADKLDAFKHWDLGDIVGAVGTLFKTRTGELSVKASEIRLLAKALRPLPEKFHGMTDQEQRYRQRYVDLITNPASRDVFIKRSAHVVQPRTSRNKPSHDLRRRIRDPCTEEQERRVQEAGDLGQEDLDETWSDALLRVRRRRPRRHARLRRLQEDGQAQAGRDALVLVHRVQEQDAAQRGEQKGHAGDGAAQDAQGHALRHEAHGARRLQGDRARINLGGEGLSVLKRTTVWPSNRAARER
jgi:hypothetical protein